jgi:hypothetical protein
VAGRGLSAVRTRLGDALATRLSPERTRRATRLERLTVGRLSADRLVKANRWLELVGKLTTALWVALIATIVLGVDWRQTVENVVNSGKPVKGAIILLIVVPTLAFVAARSLVGFARWRLQRELWRRDAERLASPGRGDARSPGRA